MDANSNAADAARGFHRIPLIASGLIVGSMIIPETCNDLSILDASGFIPMTIERRQPPAARPEKNLDQDLQLVA